MHSYSPLKEALRRWIPQPILRLRQSWINRQRASQTDRLNQSLQGRVLSGPCAGLRDPGASVGSAAGPKLLGTYEGELHGVVRALAGAGFDSVVNVGAGEGYYVVGLLTRMLGARGVAFEADQRGHDLIREMAGLNGVTDRLEVRGFCSPQDLAGVLSGTGQPVVVMDVEGAEDVLLDPHACKALLGAAILVEVHEHLQPGVAARLIGWYAASHAIDRIPTVGAKAFPLPNVPGFSSRQLRLLADEMRSLPMEWFWMTPKAE